MPERTSKDEMNKKIGATVTKHFLEKNRAYREQWLENEAKMNDEIKHNQAKGESNESIVRRMLKKYLPSKYGIVEGFLIDMNGVQSKQTDVIIYNQESHPRIIFERDSESGKTKKFVPIDSVVATIEVKTTLKDKIGEAFENIQSTRTNLALIRPSVIPEQWGVHYYVGAPTSIIFAFKSGWKNSKSIAKSVRNNIEKKKIDSKAIFDLIYVHDMDVTLGWVYGYERSEFLVRPCDHWDKSLHLTEITPGDSEENVRLGLFHFLSEVFRFASWFQVPPVDWLLYHYGPPVKRKFKTDEKPFLNPNFEPE